MVLTNAQVTAFFQNADQMAIPARTRVQLATEGIDHPSDLLEFKKDSLKQIAENLRRPSGRIPDPNAGADGGPPVGATISTPPFVLGAKSLQRLITAADIVRYYEACNRPLTAANMQWDPIVRTFQANWEALTTKAGKDAPDTPKITKILTPMKWSEAFVDHLGQVIGARHIPISYLVRTNVEPPNTIPALQANLPYSEINGSIEEELIALAPHDHPLYRDDNEVLYFKLEEATRGTEYAASIRPYQRRKNGRDAFFAIISQFAGPDKWQAELTKQDNLLHERKWTGQSNFPLEKFVGLHRHAFVTLEEASRHVAFQLPNEHTRVGYLLDGIQNSDPALQAAMSRVKTDATADGLRYNFESAAATLLPEDPVAKRRPQGGKRNIADISSVAVDATQKIGIGKTGVEFRFYKRPEYLQLSKEQKNELDEYRNTLEQQGKSRNLAKRGGPGGQGNNKKRFKRGGGGSKNLKAMISSAIQDLIKPQVPEFDVDALRKVLISAVATKEKIQTQPGKATVSFVEATSHEATPTAIVLPPKPPPISAPPQGITLQSILDRAKRS
jgi:hypothetical protein